MDVFVIKFRGHPNISAKHKTTLQITKDEHITKRADCVIGVMASHAVKDLPEWLKIYLRSGGELILEIVVTGEVFRVSGRGSPELKLSHSTDIVVRKSSYVDSRTLMINADKSAADIPHRLVNRLRKIEWFEARLLPKNLVLWDQKA